MSCYARARTHFTKAGCVQLRDEQQKVKLAALAGRAGTWHQDFQRGRLPDLLRKQILAHAVAPFWDAGVEPIASDMASWFLPLSAKLAELVHASSVSTADAGGAFEKQMLPTCFSKNAAALQREWARFDRERTTQLAASATNMLESLALGSGGGSDVTIHDAALVVFTLPTNIDLLVENRPPSAPVAGDLGASQLLAEIAVLDEQHAAAAAGDEACSHTFSRPKQQIRDKLAAWCGNGVIVGSGAVASPLSPLSLERWEMLTTEGCTANKTWIVIAAQQAVLVLSTAVQCCFDQVGWANMISIDHLRSVLMSLLLCGDSGNRTGVSGGGGGSNQRRQQCLPSRVDISMLYFGALVKRSLDRCEAIDYVAGHAFGQSTRSAQGHRWTKLQQELADYLFERCDGEGGGGAEDVFQRPRHYGLGFDGEGAGADVDTSSSISGSSGGLTSSAFFRRTFDTALAAVLQDEPILLANSAGKTYTPSAACLGRWNLATAEEHAKLHVRRWWRRPAFVRLPDGPQTLAALSPAPTELATGIIAMVVAREGSWQLPQVQFPSALLPPETVAVANGSAVTVANESAEPVDSGGDGDGEPTVEPAVGAILQLSILEEDSAYASCLQPGDTVRCAVIRSPVCGRVGVIRPKVLSFDTSQAQRLTGEVSGVGGWVGGEWNEDKIYIYCKKMVHVGGKKPGVMTFHRKDMALHASGSAEAAAVGTLDAVLGRGDTVSFELQRMPPSRSVPDYTRKVVRVSLTAKAPVFVGTGKGKGSSKGKGGKGKGGSVGKGSPKGKGKGGSKGKGWFRTPCRAGRECTRADCHFDHPEGK
jgi:hypothetical protein